MIDVRVSRLSLFLGVVLGVAGTLAVQQGLLESEADAGKQRKAQLERQHFHDSFDLVLDRYVEPVNGPEVMGRGLKHMVSGLDPYSHYLTADERKLARKRQRQGGESGLVTRLDRDPRAESSTVEVVAVEPGSPADKLGLAAGDRILSIRGEPCERMLSNVEAQLLLSGAEGERVDLRVEYGQSKVASKALSLELAKPDIDALVVAELHEQGDRAVGRIEIHRFRPGTGDRVKRELAELQRRAGKRGLDGLILDLRGNPGGEVDEAVLVADLFVDEGVVTRTRGRGGVILREEFATAAGTDLSTPLIVLQDRRSASAAELLAVALQDSGRARVIGERSYGKGTVQEVIGIPDGSLLTLTVARYFSPEDRSIDGRGVAPDSKLAEVDGEAGVDAAVQELLAIVDQAAG